jgi:integrase
MNQTYIVRTSIFTSGERFPVLLYKDTLQPVIIPTRYIIDMRRETKQSSTIERDVRVLGWFYEWANQVNIDLDQMLREGKQLTQGEIIGFFRYLRTFRQNNIIGSIAHITDENIGVLSPKTFNVYIGVIQDFLIWANNQFIPTSISENQVGKEIRQASERINRIFKSNRIGGRYAVKEGLTEDEVIALRKVIKPGAKENPFKPSSQFRNYLIIELMLATGIRRGELLKIKLNHLPKGIKQTLSVTRSPDDKEDSRRKEPQVKTLEREIPIAKSLMRDLWLYVEKHRKKGKHPYLFTSYRDGSPLSSNGVNWIYSFLVESCFPQLKGKLHPHTMRHTFNNELVRRARENNWDSNQVEKMQKYLNGWSEQSIMPQRYARRAIEGMAMELMMQFQDALYK